MSFDIIWQKIQEWALLFYDLTMTKGENNFMLIQFDILHGGSAPDGTRWFFIGSFALMILLVIGACDSFTPGRPIEGIKEWKVKISFFKVIIFTAAVFSLYTFYKMLVTLIGTWIQTDGSLRALDCLGTFINPIGIMIYAFAIATMPFWKGKFQAACLGLATFLTPAAMSYYSFSYEHIAIYLTAIAIGITGAILYKRCSPFSAYFVLSVVYLVGKFFMIFYSDQVQLLTAGGLFGKIRQYLACVAVDIIFILILLGVLLIYRVVTTEDIHLKKELVFPIIIAALMVLALFMGRTELRYQPDYENAVALMESGQYEEAITAFEELNTYKDSQERKQECENAFNQAQYDQAVGLMNAGDYAGAKSIFDQISTFGDSAAKSQECEAILQEQSLAAINAMLIGTWYGEYGSQLALREDGTCYYLDGGGTSGEGTWVYESGTTRLSVTTSALSYPIYADIGSDFQGYNFVMTADTSGWRDETFSKQ